MIPRYRRTDLTQNPTLLQGASDSVAVSTEYQTEQGGEYRIQNNSAAGYLLYVGVNGPPDFNQPAQAFSASLSLTLSWPLPGSGIQSLFVVPRYRDTWGCISQNSHPWIIRLSPAGEVLGPLPMPEEMKAFPRPNGNILVVGQYPTFELDNDAADKARVWVSTTDPPNVGLAPTFTGDVTGTAWSFAFGSYSPGTYYVAMAYYRTIDGAVSVPVYDVVVFPDLPTSPPAVFTENITP